ncbi:MAG: HAD hydrolase-like protein [Nitrososphaeria archaeon]
MDTGAILALIKAATSVELSAIAGKLNMLMLEQALSLKDIKLEEAVLFGDRLHKDIEMANMVGITFTLVITCERSRSTVIEPFRPDFVISSFKDIIEECKRKINAFFFATERYKKLLERPLFFNIITL